MSSPNCVWATPCYDQFTTTYNWENCYVWCWPVAVWIVFWYYDNNWYPNLIPGSNHFTNNNNYFVNSMIRKLWDRMWTWCIGNTGVTDSSMYTIADDYAADKWYLWTSSSLIQNLTTSQVFNHVKSEIDSEKPIVINIEWDWNIWHSVVWFWYKSNSSKVVRINLWYWWEDSYYWYYYWSNIDQNLDAVYFNWNNNDYATEVLKINISN